MGFFNPTKKKIFLRSCQSVETQGKEQIVYLQNAFFTLTKDRLRVSLICTSLNIDEQYYRLQQALQQCEPFYKPL